MIKGMKVEDALQIKNSDIAGYLNGLSAYDSLTVADLQAAAENYLTDMVIVEVVVN